MTTRILKGRRANGLFGFDVSKPGIDVLSANLVQLAFSSDYLAPVRVVSGTFVSNPINGPAPQGKSPLIPGAYETVTTIGFGRNVSPFPAVFAIATAPGWVVPLVEAPTSFLGNLVNQYHTYIHETLPGTGTVANNNTYGPTIGKTAGSLPNNFVDSTWASAKFVMVVWGDRVEFRTNCRYPMTVKYLVLEG